MNMTYDHLPKPQSPASVAACGYAAIAVENLLPAHAEIKATRLTASGGSVAVFVFCNPKLGEEQNDILLAGLRRRFGEAFFEKFEYTMRRKFAVYVDREVIEAVAG